MIRNEPQAQLSAQRQGIDYVGSWNKGEYYEFHDPTTDGNITVARSRDLRLRIIIHRISFATAARRPKT